MKFTRLRLTGFKSFCDPTELYLEPGLSGVVGPNGCGKSNLVEALRWVMGESSYKAMRASGMDDVIFSGSGSRPGRNTAEVTLVLDNSDRTAPHPLNTADVLEVTRRIEREAGSVYRVNGKEVRARDVQLLFADASTGAHSPALVRQGQIGELIAAKPQQRRALLEEAAGISGLYSRRHEAELRLRAAEQNLERVDDIIGQVEQQLETLKRQARLAVRFRALSGDIRKAEATLFHIRWVAARFAERDAEAAQAKLVRQLADAQHVELEAQKVLFLADKALQPLREADAAAGAALQRLTIAAEQLESEARRASARQSELGERRKQIEQDANRERQLVAEGDEALAASQAEILRLETEAASEVEATEAARKVAEAARLEVTAAEAEARTAADALAQLRARRAAAERALAEARQRVSRAESQLADVVREAAQVAARLDADETLSQRRSALAEAQAKTADAEQRAMAAETAAGAAQQAADAVRPDLQQLDAQVNRLDAEAQTLTRILDSGGKRRWPPVVDQLRVTPGFERALGAALGEDLEASSDAAAPLHWSPVASDDDPPLPVGVAPLSTFVTGSELLTRRLRQIGVVDAGDAPRLQAALRPGQRLVGRNGGLWRWDGFVAAADAPTAAAERLRQRNRLAEVQAELEEARTRRNARRADATALGEALTSARNAERLARDAWRLAQREIGLAQADVDKAQRAMGELATRQSALAEARTRLEAGLAEAKAAEEQASAAAGGSADEDDALTLVNEKQAQLGRLRERAEQARLKLGTFETAARMRQARLNQLGTDRAAWQRRRDGAAAQLETLATRSAEIAAELAKGESTPESFIEKRRALDLQIADARAARATSADALSVAESRHREADRAQRLAADALAGFRAEAARMEERIKGLEAAREQIERLVVEQLNILANQTAQAAGLRPEQALPDEKQVETQLDRLKAERERLGGVNLGAEREAEEVREKLDLMVKDRDDLIAAIGKLRAGIQSLNREGRQRLSEAFDKVNARFQELFTSLFGGGTAELQFVESEDPLEAGLEIIARPPGKKPSTMTLLSGEQALTAMSLIFAVFLTNPAPICVLDEVDAPLDDANVERFCNLLDMMAERTQTRFLVITHNPITMSRVDRLFGVTMMERGVSQLVSVDLSGAQRVVAAAE